MSCCVLPAKMLALSQVSQLVSKASPHDNNNNALVFKMMSSRCSSVLAARVLPRSALALAAVPAPKRCLFGAPSPADTQRLLREEQEAVQARMARRWGWDLGREAPSCTSPSSTWQWESVRASRRHPYASARLTASPLPATPAALNESTASSSSGTSTLPASPASPCSSTPRRRPTLVLPSDSEDSCCGDSGSDSDSSTTCRTSPRPAPVQTRITDFWRTRRCSASEGVVAKANPGVPTSPPSARTCPV